MDVKDHAIGRIKIVLADDEERLDAGLLTTLSVEINRNARHAVNFSGPGVFDPKTQEHIRSVIYPFVKKILALLHIQPEPIVISLANIGAASMQDKQLYVKGFSADVPIFLAILSTYLRIPLSQDFLATGHICSDQGDIALVRAIPSKIRGALQAEAISWFVCPDPDTDGSAQLIHPAITEDIKVSIAQAKSNLRFILFSSLSDLIGPIVQDRAQLQGALEAGFFGIQPLTSSNAYPYSTLVQKLTENHESRFWTIISESLFSDQHHLVQRLIFQRVQHQVKIKQYPTDFGLNFYTVLQSLPPVKRPKTILNHFINGIELKHLALLASDRDLTDFRYLHRTVASYEDIPAERVLSQPATDGDYDQLLEFLLHEIDEYTISQKVTGPIDAARLAYQPGSNTLANYNAFFAVIESFYVQLIRATGNRLNPDSQIGPAALGLLNRAMQSDRGVDLAWRQAKHGVQGGLRQILDRMTDQFKMEQREEYVEYIVTEILDPDLWPDQVKLGEAIKRNLYHVLPLDLRELPPEAMATRYKEVIRQTSHSLDGLKHYLRTLK